MRQGERGGGGVVEDGAPMVLEKFMASAGQPPKQPAVVTKVIRMVILIAVAVAMAMVTMMIDMVLVIRRLMIKAIETFEGNQTMLLLLRGTINEVLRRQLKRV